ncbi:probable E3 ubiquitin-protein ligase DTX3 [Octopus vulgaris]|uniref:E3 ubiquitin-protein ligase n=1 Tax=Octopus vulgaris TaxID=6645 RepID=A0AA36FDE5_OCTVU|nr:probable E3 ubiquitin-protein ligase DTX3 [Octopus vulgaris]
MTGVKCSLHGCCIEAYIGDITKVKCDAIVCASDSRVALNAGLLGEIKKAGGSPILEEIDRKLKRLPGKNIKPGQVLVTGAGKMHCEFVMYINGPAISSGDKTIESAIMTWLLGIPYDTCVQQYVSAIKNWPTSLPKTIHFVLFDDDMFNKIKDSFKANFSKWHPSTADSTSNANTEEKSRKKKSSGKSGHRNQPEKHGRDASYMNDTSDVDSASDVEDRSDVEDASEAKGASGGQNGDCPICLCPITDAKTLSLCGHVFCQQCIDHSFSAIGQYCPICLKVYGVITGNQPSSSMTVQDSFSHLPGFENSHSYQISYHIPGGVQGKNHPNPGKSYYGTDRTAYLPKTEQGTTVLKMLQLAFSRRLIFTVGKSRTTNMENMVTWNDIHHKTSRIGGPSGFGYPDDDYLNRVTSELSAKGITPEDVADKRVKSKINIT